MSVYHVPGTRPGEPSPSHKLLRASSSFIDGAGALETWQLLESTSPFRIVVFRPKGVSELPGGLVKQRCWVWKLLIQWKPSMARKLAFLTSSQVLGSWWFQNHCSRDSNWTVILQGRNEQWEKVCIFTLEMIYLIKVSWLSYCPQSVKGFGWDHILGVEANILVKMHTHPHLLTGNSRSSLQVFNVVVKFLRSAVLKPQLQTWLFHLLVGPWANYHSFWAVISTVY